MTRDIPPPAAHPEGRDPNASFTLAKDAFDALRRGSAIEAIKIVRERTGVGLAEAKNMVGEIQKSLPDVGAAPRRATPANVKPGQGLAPGQVAEGAGVGKWLVLVAFAALAVVAVLNF